MNAREGKWRKEIYIQTNWNGNFINFEVEHNLPLLGTNQKYRREKWEKKKVIRIRSYEKGMEKNRRKNGWIATLWLTIACDAIITLYRKHRPAEAQVQNDLK